MDAFKLARGFVYAGVKRIGLAPLALLPRFGGEVPHGDEGRCGEVPKKFRVDLHPLSTGRHPSVILFRNQETSDDVQIAFSRPFGPLERTKVGSRGTGSFYVHSTNVAADATLVAETDRQALANRANQLWHTDSSFKATPPLASVLSARKIPKDGGETEFVSTRLAWDRLSDEQRDELRDLVVVHSYATSRDQIDPALMTPVERAALPAVRWRLIWRNPANARDALYIASHAGAIEGMDDARSRALLARLIDEATQSAHVYSHPWRTGDVILWDNRTK